MKRSKMIRSLNEMDGSWDFIIIGGGATGLGVAVDAASRGYKTLLLEMEDFANGTSSKSTKLVHGGVRYLEQGNISLVYEALKERGILFKNAPHLVHKQPFVVPFYKWWKGFYYWMGLRTYDLLAGKKNIGFSKFLSGKKVVEEVPGVNAEGLSGGILYYDGQFDDSRLAVNLAQTSVDNGGVLINYMKVTDLLKSVDNEVVGVKATDQLNDKKYKIKGRAVINATGVFTDDILKMDDSINEEVIQPSQGIHIVIDREFLASDTAIMIPKTVDGRVLFAIPWHEKVMIGTTDTPVQDISNEPKALDEEVEYILDHVSSYLTKKPTKKDIKSVFAGLRPLVNRSKSGNTAEISRDHSLFVAPSGLITIAGGKWTTYRKMAEDVVERVISSAGLENRACITEDLKVHGWEQNIHNKDALHYYGSDRKYIETLIGENPEYGEQLHPRLPYLKAEVIWSTRHEMAMTVEDFLARRTRALFIDAEASVEMAPEVAALMAEEAGFDEEWVEEQVALFKELAASYHVNGLQKVH